MPELLDLAKEAFEKARLFGSVAAQDLNQQHQANMAPKDPIEALIQGLMSGPSGGYTAPSVDQSVSSGLGALGMAGGREAGISAELPGGLGEFSLGPREGLGLLAGMAVPGGPGGKLQGIAAKAGKNITSRMGAGAQRLARKAELQPKLAPPGGASSPGQSKLQVNRANELAEPKAEILDDLFTPAGPVDPALQPELGYSRTANKLSIRPGGPEAQIPPATPINQSDPNTSIELAKKKLAEHRYNLGTEKDVVSIGDEGPLALPPQRMVPEYGEEPDFPLLQNNKGSRVRDTNQREMELAYGTENQEGNLERWGPTRFAEDAEASGIPGMEADIGEPRRGNTFATGLEDARYQRILQARAERIYQEELAKVGGDPMKHTAFTDYLDNMIYSTQNRKNKYGEVIEPLDPIPPLHKRVADAEETRQVGKGIGWKPKQPRQPGKPQTIPYRRTEGSKPLPLGDKPLPGGVEGPVRLPEEGPVREGWEKSPENKEWLRREALAVITGTERDNRFANRTPEYVADRLLRDHAENAANALHPDSPLSVSTQSHKQPSKFSHANADEGGSQTVDELDQVVRGSEDTAKKSLGDLDKAKTERPDAFDQFVDYQSGDILRQKNRRQRQESRRPPVRLSKDPEVVAERKAGGKRGIPLGEEGAYKPESKDEAQAALIKRLAEAVGLGETPAPRPAAARPGPGAPRAGRAEPNHWFRIQGYGGDPSRTSAAGGVDMYKVLKAMGLA